VGTLWRHYLRQEPAIFSMRSAPELVNSTGMGSFASISLDYWLNRQILNNLNNAQYSFHQLRTELCRVLILSLNFGRPKTSRSSSIIAGVVTSVTSPTSANRSNRCGIPVHNNAEM
jgi:hypothetical protein